MVGVSPRQFRRFGQRVDTDHLIRPTNRPSTRLEPPNRPSRGAQTLRSFTQIRLVAVGLCSQNMPVTF